MDLTRPRGVDCESVYPHEFQQVLETKIFSCSFITSIFCQSLKLEESVNTFHICYRCKNTEGNVTVSVYFDKSTPAITSSEKVIDEMHKLTTVLEDALQEYGF